MNLNDHLVEVLKSKCGCSQCIKKPVSYTVCQYRPGSVDVLIKDGNKAYTMCLK